ncbi:MAG: hypothetical protein A2Y28_02400 [Chlamydiae bacterium GWC2_50_10]|nr:MAG: hypothetical protein A2Y28_02400 [Chlamydiae bacterium GWC2_50_10]
MSSKKTFNYFYFTLFFFVLLALSLLQLSTLSSNAFSFLFLTDAIGQSLLEVLLAIFMATLIESYFPRPFFPLFIALTLFILFFHIVDFFLVRLLDFTIWFALDFVFEDELRNFLELLYASNVSLIAWGGVLIAIIAFVSLGLLFYAKTARLSQRKLLRFSIPMQVLSLSTLLFALAVWDFSTRPFFSFAVAEKHEKALPLKFTFFSHSCPTLCFHSPLKPSSASSLPCLLQAKKKPDIFLFIVESLREDFITETITPHLNAFRNGNLFFNLALSSANGTHLSWFSLFYSQLPFYWKKVQKEPKKRGSPALHLFKELGYEISVYSASHLSYYQMDEVLFGENRTLADSFRSFPHHRTNAPWESDEKAVQSVCTDLCTLGSSPPRLFILFLDATHFDYSWPEERGSLFVPYAKGASYWKATLGQADIPGIKNRYRNALFQIDTLFGSFLKRLHTTERGKDSFVIFTADHGEEFCEKGFLFHGSHLSKEQTHIPLYYRFGPRNELISKKTTEMTSPLDLFPTLFHVLCEEEVAPALFQGESVFKDKRWPFVATARYNAGRTPYEFFLHDGKNKVVVQLADRSCPLSSKEIKLLSFTTADDKPLALSTDEVQQRFQSAFTRLFNLP